MGSFIRVSHAVRLEVMDMIVTYLNISLPHKINSDDAPNLETRLQAFLLCAYLLILSITIMQVVNLSNRLAEQPSNQQHGPRNHLQVQLLRRGGPYPRSDSPVAVWRASLRNKTCLEDRRANGNSSSDGEYFK